MATSSSLQPCYLPAGLRAVTAVFEPSQPPVGPGLPNSPPLAGFSKTVKCVVLLADKSRSQPFRVRLPDPPPTLCRVPLHSGPPATMASALKRPLSSLSEPVFSLGKCMYARGDLCSYVRCERTRKRSGLPIFVPTRAAAHDVSIWRYHPSRRRHRRQGRSCERAGAVTAALVGISHQRFVKYPRRSRVRSRLTAV